MRFLKPPQTRSTAGLRLSPFGLDGATAAVDGRFSPFGRLGDSKVKGLAASFPGETVFLAYGWPQFLCDLTMGG